MFHFTTLGTGSYHIYNGPAEIPVTHLQNEITSVRINKSIVGEIYEGCFNDSKDDRYLKDFLGNMSP